MFIYKHNLYECQVVSAYATLQYSVPGFPFPTPCFPVALVKPLYPLQVTAQVMSSVLGLDLYLLAEKDIEIQPGFEAVRCSYQLNHWSSGI